MSRNIKAFFKGDKFKRAVGRLMPIASLALVLAIWAIISVALGVEVILPSPKATFTKLYELFAEKAFWQAVGSTSLRALAGFCISFVLAMAFSVFSYVVPIFGKLFSPIISIVRSTPTMSVILVVIIWVSSKFSPMLIAGLIAFPMLYAGFYGALADISKDLVNMAKLYNVPLKKRIFKMYVPEVLPAIFATSQGVISLTLKVTISGEVLAQTVGSMGIYMQVARVYLDAASLFAWTVAAIVLGFIAELIVLGIKKIVIRW